MPWCVDDTVTLSPKQAPCRLNHRPPTLYLERQGDERRRMRALRIRIGSRPSQMYLSIGETSKDQQLSKAADVLKAGRWRNDSVDTCRLSTHHALGSRSCFVKAALVPASTSPVAWS